MNTGLIIGIISLSLVSIVAVVVVVIMNKKTSPNPTFTGGDTSGLFKSVVKRERPTSGPTVVPTSGPTVVPTITQNKVLTKTQVPPKDYTKLYEYLPSVKEVSGYTATYAPNAYVYSLLNTSPYNITKVGFNFMTDFPGVGTWLYKLDKNKVASPQNEWATIYGSNKYIQDILIEPGEFFVINMQQLRGNPRVANFEIKFVEVLLPV
jgi:hypothetical protein